MYRFQSIFVILSLINYGACFVNTPIVLKDSHVLKKWQAAMAEFDSIAFSRRNIVINELTAIISNDTVSETLSDQCIESLIRFKSGLVKRETDAYRMLDSAAKNSARFTNGYIAELGSRETCLLINHGNDVDNSAIKGRYCLITATFPTISTDSYKKSNDRLLSPLHLSNATDGTLLSTWAQHYDFFETEGLTFGVCVPSACSRDDLAQITSFCEL